MSIDRFKRKRLTSCLDLQNFREPLKLYQSPFKIPTSRNLRLNSQTRLKKPIKSNHRKNLQIISTSPTKQIDENFVLTTQMNNEYTPNEPINQFSSQNCFRPTTSKPLISRVKHSFKVYNFPSPDFMHREENSRASKRLITTKKRNKVSADSFEMPQDNQNSITVVKKEITTRTGSKDLENRLRRFVDKLKTEVRTHKNTENKTRYEDHFVINGWETEV